MNDKDIGNITHSAILSERRRTLRALLSMGMEFSEEMLTYITALTKEQIQEVKEESEF